MNLRPTLDVRREVGAMKKESAFMVSTVKKWILFIICTNFDCTKIYTMCKITNLIKKQDFFVCFCLFVFVLKTNTALQMITFPGNIYSQFS